MDTLISLLFLACLITSGTAQDIDGFLDAVRSSNVEVSSVSFSNWGSTVSRGSVYKISPTDQSQVKNVIASAYDYQIRVRATGSMHAFSDLFSDDNQVWLDMSRYQSDASDRIYMSPPTFQRDYPQVTVNPSQSMADMVAFMAERGVSLPSFPAVLSTSPMGVTATGAHGMSWRDGPVSSHLVNVQFINGEGEYRVFDVDQNGDAFNLFRSHLGLCGVVTEMTFKVEGWSLMSKYTDVRMTYTDLFYNITALRLLLEENHSWLATWDIFSSLTEQQVSDIATNGGVTDSWVPADDYATFVIVQNLVGGTSDVLAAADAGTIFATNFTLGGDFYSYADVSYGYLPELGELDPVEENTLPVHSEFGFSVNENNFRQVEQVLEILFAETLTYATTHTSRPMNSVQFAFFRHNSSCILCHSNVADSSVNSNSQSDLIFMVNFVLEASQISEFNTLIAQIYASWKASNLQGLPHFGKYIPTVTDITDDIISQLGGKIDAFRELRKNVGLDSIDLLTNDFLDSIIFHDTERVLRDGTGSGTGSSVRASVFSIAVVSIGYLLFSIC